MCCSAIEVEYDTLTSRSSMSVVAQTAASSIEMKPMIPEAPDRELAEAMASV
jgi:hypothetical protein